jgi:hypothetical protein
VRRLTDRARLERFMALLGRGSREATIVYLTGGATAVLQGFRDATVDIDILRAAVDEMLEPFES